MASALLVALLIVGLVVGTGWYFVRGGSGRFHPVSGASPVDSAARGSTAQAIAASTPAVVDINTFTSTSFVGGTPSGSHPLGAGTGMILTSSGEVLTNNHVIRGATSIRVTVPSIHATYPATVVGADPADDVALIQIQGASGLPTVALDQSSLRVGQKLVAIGNALGRGGTPKATVGTITGLDRSISVSDGHGGTERLQGMIQTDAPISRGDSGGALVDRSGEVIGMITAGQQSPGPATTSRVSFAIPSNDAIAIVDQIRTGQETSSVVIGPAGFLGVEVTDLSPQSAAQAGLAVTSGALVVGVLQGTPADRAGISANAAITAIDDQRISSVDALGAALHGRDPGNVVRVTWAGVDGVHTSTVSLIEGPAV